MTVANDGNALFDALYYLSRNPDVFHAGVDPLDHFNSFGWQEGRDPNACSILGISRGQQGRRGAVQPARSLSSARLARRTRSVGQFRHHPLSAPQSRRGGGRRRSARALSRSSVGARAAGLHGGRRISPASTRNTICSTIPTWRRPGSIRCTHFDTSGWHEGRKPNAWFDTAGYLAHYADVAAAGINPLEHYESSAGPKAAIPRPASTRSAIWRPIRTSRRRTSIRSTTTCTFGIYEGRSIVSDGIWHREERAAASHQPPSRLIRRGAPAVAPGAPRLRGGHEPQGRKRMSPQC